MEIITQKFNSIGINFVQDFDKGTNEVGPFISSLSKFKAIINKPGFGNSNKFSKEEKELWNEVFSQLIPDKKSE